MNLYGAASRACWCYTFFFGTRCTLKSDPSSISTKPIDGFPSDGRGNSWVGGSRTMSKVCSASATKARLVCFARLRPGHMVAPPPKGRRLGCLRRAGSLRNLSGLNSEASAPNACLLKCCCRWGTIRRLPARKILPPILTSHVRKRTDAAKAVIRMVSSHMLFRHGQVMALTRYATSTVFPFNAGAVSSATAWTKSLLNNRYESIQNGALRVFPLILRTISENHSRH